MSKKTRRAFLKIAGIGTAVAAGGAAIPAASVLSRGSSGAITIRAIGGVPAQPLPSYASYVLEGYVDPVRKTGVLTRTLFAGAPGAMSAIALPGLSRTVQVVDVQQEDRALSVRGVIADRSQLLRGESDEMTLWIDRATNTIRARSGGNEVKLSLQP